MTQPYLIIGADFAPIENDEKKIINRQVDKLVDTDIVALIRNASFSVFNMEAPIADEGTPIAKDGPNLKICKGSESIYSHMKVGLLSLANNHIMDYGKEALDTTIQTLNEMNIPYIGVGQNSKEADSYYITSVNNKKIGIYAVAEHEFSIATITKPGANGLSDYTFTKICEIKKECDYLIVLYHGGRELYEYPTPNQQILCRKIADAGADLIVCQHSHCIGAIEQYQTSTIFYGQGNFIFGNPESPICENSILIKVIVDDKLTTEIVPIIRKKDFVALADEQSKININEHIDLLSSNMKEEKFVEENYKEMVKTAINSALYQYAGWPLFLIRLDKLLGRRMIRRSFIKKQKRLLYLQNLLQCETHRELMIEGFKSLYEEAK